MVEKRYNFRIYPTKAQASRIEENFGCRRFVYNHYLDKRMETYEREGRLLGLNECGRDLTRLKRTEGHAWLAAADVRGQVLRLRLRRGNVAPSAEDRRISRARGSGNRAPPPGRQIPYYESPEPVRKRLSGGASGR